MSTSPLPPKPTSSGRLTLAALVAAMLLVPLVALLLVRALLPAGPTLGVLATPPVSASASGSEPVTAPVALDRTPEIRGRILDANGDAVDGAAVRLVSPDPPYTVVREANTDPAGAFSFPRVHATRVRVVADHDPDGVVSSAELHATEGQTLDVTLVLSLANAVRGTVVDAADHPVAGAALSVEGVPWTVRSATSDEAGAFRLTTVPEGATSLLAVARGYKTARVALLRRDDQADELVVQVRLLAASPVAGDVRDPEGNPAKARVVACEGQPQEVRTTSGDDGTFELAPSAIGCDVVAEHDEYAPSETGTVTEGRRLSLRLKAGGVIEGTVVDERGAPVQAYSVGVESFSAARGKSLRRDPARKIEDVRGAFRLDKLAPGSYVLSASTGSSPPARSDSIEVSAGATTRGVRIVLGAGGTVAGHVYDESHAPLPDVEVRFDAVSSTVESGARATTDAAGAYRIEGAPHGPFTLYVHKDGFRLRLLSGLRVDAHATLALDVTLTSFDGGAGMEYAGIGARLQQTPEGIVLAAIFPGEPADRAGLRSGDRIQQIDGEETSAMSVADVLQRLRGEAKTSVGVSVLRPETGETLDLVVGRTAIVR